MAFRYEYQLEEATVDFLSRKTFKYSWQVPLHNRVIDLAAIDKNDQLIGIEYKLKNWKRALRQAALNSNSFDYVYVCLPRGKYIEELKRSARTLGIGVMIYDEDKEEIKIELYAEKIKRQWEPNLQYIREYIKKRGLNGN